MAEYDGSVTVEHSYSYDGYGVLLQNEDNFTPPDGTQVPGKVAQQATSLLYAGEHFDTDMQNYYLRARWYTVPNKTFRKNPDSFGTLLHDNLKFIYLICNELYLNHSCFQFLKSHGS